MKKLISTLPTKAVIELYCFLYNSHNYVNIMKDSKLVRALGRGIKKIKHSLDENSWMFSTQTFTTKVRAVALTHGVDPIDVATQARIIDSYEADERELIEEEGSNFKLKHAIQDVIGNLEIFLYMHT